MANYTGRARLTSDLWTLQVLKSDGVSCRDGTTAPSTETYAFDDVSLAGTHTSIHGDVCGLQPAMTKTPFTLAFQGPLSAPVERYPLDCNEIGHAAEALDGRDVVDQPFAADSLIVDPQPAAVVERLP